QVHQEECVVLFWNERRDDIRPAELPCTDVSPFPLPPKLLTRACRATHLFKERCQASDWRVGEVDLSPGVPGPAACDSAAGGASRQHFLNRIGKPLMAAGCDVDVPDWIDSVAPAPTLRERQAIGLQANHPVLNVSAEHPDVLQRRLGEAHDSLRLGEAGVCPSK